MIKIIDIIRHEGKYSTQLMLVVDRKPLFKYERVGDVLIGEDSGFFNFFLKQNPCSMFRAFAGREFDIPLKDGSIIKARGQWWDHFPSDWAGLVCGLGVATIEDLERCYVFTSMKVDKNLVHKWLELNEPSNNYYKYDRRSSDYGKHKVEKGFK